MCSLKFHFETFKHPMKLLEFRKSGNVINLPSTFQLFLLRKEEVEFLRHILTIHMATNRKNKNDRYLCIEHMQVPIIFVFGIIAQLSCQCVPQNILGLDKPRHHGEKKLNRRLPLAETCFFSFFLAFRQIFKAP